MLLVGFTVVWRTKESHVATGTEHNRVCWNQGVTVIEHVVIQKNTKYLKSILFFPCVQ